MITVNRNLRLATESKAIKSAAKLINQGALALCNNAPSQIAPPIATAR